MKQVDNRYIYPMACIDDTAYLDRCCSRLGAQVKSWWHSAFGKRSEFLKRVEKYETEVQELNDEEAIDKLWALRKELRVALVKKETGSESICCALAILRMLSSRYLGMRHHDVQLLGCQALLSGSIAEMHTGEGKSLTAVPATCIAVIAGFKVHVITVNQYLAARDAENFNNFYQRLGLDVGLIKSDMSSLEKAREYRKPIVYCTNKDVAFDYLRDVIGVEHFSHRGKHFLNHVLDTSSQNQDTLLPGLEFAIVDEIDSILVDEASTPLIISRSTDGAELEDIYRLAYQQSRRFIENEHFKIDRQQKNIVWLQEHEDVFRDISAQLGGLWSSSLFTKELIEKALFAQFILLKDHDYAIIGGVVQIIDEYTGRRMPDRSWEGGLHQFVEIKEDVDVTPPKETLAKTTFQRFFMRYLKLSGMSGTVREIASEMYDVYELDVIRIPTNQPGRRISMGQKVCKDKKTKLDYIVSEIRRHVTEKRPVLVGTRTVADSDELSLLLKKVDIQHSVLNARQDREEAEIVAKAGLGAQVTVATNMAGRGTDIALSEEARHCGGLHVIATELHDSFRIDRQLFGRCARQGDPGSYQQVCAFDDEILRNNLPAWATGMGEILCDINSQWAQSMAFALARYSQKRAERQNYLIRKDVQAAEEQMRNSLKFSGRAQ